MVDAERTSPNWKLYGQIFGAFGIVLRVVSFFFIEQDKGYAWAPDFPACCIWIYGVNKHRPQFMCSALVIFGMKMCGTIMVDIAVVIGCSLGMTLPWIFKEYIPESILKGALSSALFVALATLVLGLMFIYLGKVIYRGFRLEIESNKFEDYTVNLSQMRKEVDANP